MVQSTGYLSAFSSDSQKFAVWAEAGGVAQSSSQRLCLQKLISTPKQQTGEVDFNEKTYLKSPMDTQNVNSVFVVLFHKQMVLSFSVKSALIFGDHLEWLKNI